MPLHLLLEFFSIHSSGHIHILVREDFPGGPVVETSPSTAGAMGSIPGQEARIPHVLRPKNQTINSRSNIVTNSITTLKVVHINKKYLKKKTHRNGHSNLID